MNEFKEMDRYNAEALYSSKKMGGGREGGRMPKGRSGTCGVYLRWSEEGFRGMSSSQI